MIIDKNQIELKINGTELIIGSIQVLELPDASLLTDGFVDRAVWRY